MPHSDHLDQFNTSLLDPRIYVKVDEEDAALISLPLSFEILWILLLLEKIVGLWNK